MGARKNTDPTQLAPTAADEDPEKQGCFMMYLSGFEASEIESRTGIPANRINQWIWREKWKEQKTNLENLRREKNPPMSHPIVNAVINSRKGELREKFIANMGEIAAEDSEHWKDMSPEERLVAAPGIVPLAGVHRKSLNLDGDEEGKERGHISLSFLINAKEEGMVKVLPKESVKEIDQ